MQRRDFIRVIGATTVLPVLARAQPRIPVVGVMHQAADSESRRADLAVFLSNLAQRGYVHDRNVKIEYRWADNQVDLLPVLAADFVNRQVAVIAALLSTPCALAAKAATQTTPIPVVFIVGTNPVQYGLVKSFSNPGGNLTGVTVVVQEISAKKLELLHNTVPTANPIAVLVNPNNPSSAGGAASELNELVAAKDALDVRLRVLPATSPSDIETAFATLSQERVGALLVSGDVLFLSARDQIIALAARYAVPAIYQYPEMARAGGLMSYGPNISEAYGIAGDYTGRILDGEKPASMPVQQLSKLNLMINLKTANALGLSIPQALLSSADELIE
jgi:putative ABC transport system substrate-binding protein